MTDLRLCMIIIPLPTTDIRCSKENNLPHKINARQKKQKIKKSEKEGASLPVVIIVCVCRLVATELFIFTLGNWIWNFPLFSFLILCSGPLNVLFWNVGIQSINKCYM